MAKFTRFLRYQREQNGVLTLEDAADLCRATVSMVKRWAAARRISWVTHRGRRYFGVNSLLEWSNYRRGFASFRQVDKPQWPGEDDTPT